MNAALLSSPGLVLGTAALVIAIAGAWRVARRAKHARQAKRRQDPLRAREHGHEARLQFPAIDLTRCVGCGICVRACPEDGVLALVHGQARVVHGARCLGHARCAAECPTGAIAVELPDLEGRRGVPSKLGVPGEELSKVVYGLIDAQSYQARRVLVVGGGDSAVEAALALAEQPGNAVTLAHREKGFSRIKEENRKRIWAARTNGAVRVLFQTRVHRIAPDTVELRPASSASPETLALPNDDVFVLAGGRPPLERLETSGVSFDPAAPPLAPEIGRRTGPWPAWLASALLALACAAWALHYGSYYRLPLAERPDSRLHELLRPSGGAGLAFGATALLALLAHLAYLLPRTPRIAPAFGSLRRGMSVRVVTGVAALGLALLHWGLAPGQTLGSHALLGLGVLVATDAIERHLYGFVPRAANGRELGRVEARAAVARLADEWRGKDPARVQELRGAIDELVSRGSGPRSLPRRVLALRCQQIELELMLVRMGRAAAAAGLDRGEIQELQSLARRAHRSTWVGAHGEELRRLLASWRTFHRWVALLVALLVLVHVLSSLH